MPDPPQRTVQVTPPDSKTAGETPPNEEKVSSPQTTGKTPNQLLPLPEWLARLPDVNAGLNSLATVLLLFGFVAVKQKRLQLHKTLMLTAFAASIAFLGCYLLHHYGLYKWTGSGSKKFTGTGIVRPVYFAILISHVVLAMLVPVLALITIVRGLKDQREKHRRIARITFPIWLYVSVSGVVIYGFLYHWPVSN